MAQLDLEIKQGKTFSRIFRWGAEPILFLPITAASQAAPVQLTVTAHGLPDGWPVVPVSLKGMVELNCPHDPPWASDYKTIIVVNANTVKLDKVNSADFSAYTSGGYLRTYTPVDLSLYKARMKIKDRIGGTVLATLTSLAGDIILNNTTKTITVTLGSVATAAYTWTRGVYDLELYNDGVSPEYVKELASGDVTVTREVTT